MRWSSGLVLCACLASVQGAALKAISLKGDLSDSGVISYGESGVVSITVEDYKDGDVPLSSLSTQGRVHIVLARQDEEGEWQALPCRIFPSSKYQECDCDGDSETLKFEEFPQCVTPGDYKLMLEFPGSDITLAEPIMSSLFKVVLSDVPCEAGYFSEDGTNKQPGCQPCGVGTYRTANGDFCESCPEGKTTYDRGSTSDTPCEALPNPQDKFVAFASSFFMLSNAGGLSLEAHEDATPDECVVKCAQDPGCKAFDAGNDGRVPEASTYQKGDCFLSYDTEKTIKERDVREVSQLMLYRKVDSVEMRQTWFRRTVDGFIQGNDAGGTFRNEHSPDACAQLCLDDINCVSFDAGRQFAVKWEADARGKEWQSHIDNCYLSYKKRADVATDRWVDPNCRGKPDPLPTGGPFDMDCSNDDSNGIDYYERIIPQFVEFDVKWADLVNPKYFSWKTPLMKKPADDGDDGYVGYYGYDDEGDDDYGFGQSSSQQQNGGQQQGNTDDDGAGQGQGQGQPNDDGGQGQQGNTNDDGAGAQAGQDGQQGGNNDGDDDEDKPDDYYEPLFYDAPRQYASESRPPRKDLDKTILARYPHIGTRDAMAQQVVEWAKKLISDKNGDTDVEVAATIEPGADGKVVAHINTGSDKNDAIMEDSSLSAITFKCPEGWDACTYSSSSSVDAKKLDKEDMKCEAGTVSASGFGQGESCIPCGLDRYPNGPQTDCTLCPQGTATKVGARVKGARAKEGERQCVVIQDQVEAKKGSFRVGYEWHGTFTAPLGAESYDSNSNSGRYGQGDIKMRVTEATIDEREEGKVNLKVFVEAQHGEDCNRDRAAGNSCVCTGGRSCRCTDPAVQRGPQCLNSDCSCRDPGLTSYYLSGYATATDVDLMTLAGFSGITDRNDWLFVARGFQGKISIEKGNTVISGKFATPEDQPGNSVGPITIEALSVDRSADSKKCNTDKFGDDFCQDGGSIKLTERCYAAVEVGSFSIGDSFVGSHRCYRPGTNMRVSGLNKRPVENVRKLDATVTSVETGSDGKTIVTAEVTIGTGSLAKDDFGEGRYLASGEYDATTGGIELIPNKAGWLTAPVKAFPARMLKGGLTAEGELIVGTILPNPLCKCKRGFCDTGYDVPICETSEDCADAEQLLLDADDDDSQDDGWYRACDAYQDFGEESKGFQEECTAFSLARVCQAPEPVCDVGWTLFPESERCYKYMKDEMTFDDAQDACEDVGAQLASIHGSDENKKVGELAKSFGREDGDFFWIGLTVTGKLPSWLDETAFTYRGHTRDSSLRPKGPCGAYKVGSLWQTSDIPDSSTSCADATLPFVCKKPPAGQLSPCTCNGQSDVDHFGGHCAAWTPNESGWGKSWCYVAKNCERAVKQSNGKFRASCTDPNAKPKTTTAAVSTKYSGDASCNKGQFQTSNNECADCKTESDCDAGKVLSSKFKDTCGANDGDTPNFKDHDFTCCTPYFAKVAECARSGKGVSDIKSCRGGKDFECQQCPAGTYFPTNRAECKDPAKAQKNSKVCKCLPCNVLCETCSEFSDSCTSCTGSLFLRKARRAHTCTSSCDPKADDQGAKRISYGNNETKQCSQCRDASACPGTTVIAKCSKDQDTQFEGEFGVRAKVV
jgi:hypothetical protein